MISIITGGFFCGIGIVAGIIVTCLAIDGFEAIKSKLTSTKEN